MVFHLSVSQFHEIDRLKAQREEDVLNALQLIRFAPRVAQGARLLSLQDLELFNALTQVVNPSFQHPPDREAEKYL